MRRLQRPVAIDPPHLGGQRHPGWAGLPRPFDEQANLDDVGQCGPDPVAGDSRVQLADRLARRDAELCPQLLVLLLQGREQPVRLRADDLLAEGGLEHSRTGLRRQPHADVRGGEDRAHRGVRESAGTAGARVAWPVRACGQVRPGDGDPLQSGRCRRPGLRC
ncbi:hypothetical protein GCM10027610_021940 [Dactylosporangium cerinum]